MTAANSSWCLSMMAVVVSLFLEIFPRPEEAQPLYDVAPHFAFAVLQGLALDANILPGQSRVQDVLNTLKRVAALVLPIS